MPNGTTVYFPACRCLRAQWHHTLLCCHVSTFLPNPSMPNGATVYFAANCLSARLGHSLHFCPLPQGLMWPHSQICCQLPKCLMGSYSLLCCHVPQYPMDQGLPCCKLPQCLMGPQSTLLPIITVSYGATQSICCQLRQFPVGPQSILLPFLYLSAQWGQSLLCSHVCASVSNGATLYFAAMSVHQCPLGPQSTLLHVSQCPMGPQSTFLPFASLLNWATQFTLLPSTSVPHGATVYFAANYLSA